MRIRDLGTLDYGRAWKIQEETHACVLDGGQETAFLLEHTPVITTGRRVADAMSHLIAGRDALERLGVELTESDRGGDITFHGPGQLVAYPIIHLARHGMSVGGYVRKLQEIAMESLADFGIAAKLDPKAVGLWVDSETAARDGQIDRGIASPSPAKICALGVRVRRGVSLHGIALNVTTDLSYFSLINPCGLSRPVTSMHELLGDSVPSMVLVKQSLIRHLEAAFG